MNEKSVNQGVETREKIMQFIVSYIEEHGYPPSVREICVGAEIKATSTVHDHVKRLLELGLLETDAEPGTSRAIRVKGYRFAKEGDTDD